MIYYFLEKTIIIDEEVEIPLEKTGLDGYKVLYNVDCSEVIEFKNNKIILKIVIIYIII